MPTETEIKIRLAGPAEAQRVIESCKQQGVVIEREIIQRDEYFDTANEALKGADLTLRLRTVAARTWVAMKSPRVYREDNTHSRIELEFEVANETEVRAVIGNGGLQATAILEKRRRHYQVERCSVVIDSIPFAGTFVEVEGPNHEEILQVVGKLGLALNDSVKENYSELLEAELKARGLPLRPNLRGTFDAEAENRAANQS